MPDPNKIPTRVNRLEREGLAGKVASVLRTGIIEGKFAPGERLPENWLAAQLGVSLAPIREAFRILEIEGLVQVNLQKGARVRGLTAKDIESIYDVRSTLDSLAVRLAMTNLQAVDVCRLEKILSSMKVSIDKKDFSRYRKVNSEFHSFFYQKSQNEWLCNMNHGLMNHIMRLRSFSLSMPARLLQSYREHTRIIETVKKRNVREAEKLMREHTREAGRFVLRRFLEQDLRKTGR
jgi:DNA-binding GntR family transcriptional regulator